MLYRGYSLVHPGGGYLVSGWVLQARRRRACCPSREAANGSIEIRSQKACSLVSIIVPGGGGGMKFNRIKDFLGYHDRYYAHHFENISENIPQQSRVYPHAGHHLLCDGDMFSIRDQGSVTSFALSSPVIILKIVDFPAPFCPIRVIFDPSRTEKAHSHPRSHFGGAYPIGHFIKSDNDISFCHTYRGKLDKISAGLYRKIPKCKMFIKN
jgi:hypothetical protein